MLSTATLHRIARIGTATTGLLPIDDVIFLTLIRPRLTYTCLARQVCKHHIAFWIPDRDRAARISGCFRAVPAGVPDQRTCVIADTAIETPASQVAPIVRQ